MRLKNSAFACIALLLALAAAALAQQSISEVTIFSGESVSVEGRTFIIYKSVNNQEVIADYGDGTLFIANNSCQQSDNVRICLDNIEFEDITRTYKIKLTTLSLAPDISISRSAASNEFEAGDGTKVTVTVSNTGGLAKDVTYTDSFPESIEITSVDGAVIRGNSVVWEKRSMKAESESFSYSIRVNDVIDRSFSASLTYFDGRREQTVRSSSVDIKTAPRLLQEIILGFDSLFIGEKNNLTLNFTNREPLTANVSVDLLVDEGLEMTKVPGEFRKIDATHFRGSFLITKTNRTFNKSRDFYFEFIGTKTGTFNLRSTASYFTRDVPERKLPGLTSEFKVADRGVKVRSNLDDYELEAGQGKTMRFWLQNLNPGISIKKVLVSTDGGGLLELPDVYVETLGPYEHRKIIEKFFYAPRVNRTDGYTVRVNVTYLTEFGDNFSKSFVFTETVNAIQDLAITQSFGKQELESGGETTVSARVKNPRKTRLKSIAVKDAIPEGFAVFGRTSGIISLDQGDEQTVYTYVLKAPRVLKETSYAINTTISYSEGNAGDSFSSPEAYKASASKTLTVKPQKFVLSATATLSDTTVPVGHFFEVDFKLENPSSDTAARGIVIELPVQDEVDLAAGNRLVDVGNLGPGEEIVLTGAARYRAKKAGNFKLGNSRLTYANPYGEEFEVNITGGSFKAEERSGSDAYIFVEKNATPKVNNTDFFEVGLRVKNVGEGIVSVELEDGSFRKSFALRNGSTASFAYREKIESPGAHALQPAIAIYSSGGHTLMTGSNSPSVEVVDNPVLRVEKIAPAEVTSSEEFGVTLKAVVLAKGITNITLSDSGHEYHYDELGSEAEESYALTLRDSGAAELPAATAAYVYEGKLYRAISGSPSVFVNEQTILLIRKSVNPESASEGEKVESAIYLRNAAHDELRVTLSDSGETWDLTLAPGEERKISHEVMAEEVGEAAATFEHGGKLRKVSAAPPEFKLAEAENGKVIKEQNEGIVARIVGLLKAILTFQR